MLVHLHYLPRFNEYAHTCLPRRMHIRSITANQVATCECFRGIPRAEDTHARTLQSTSLTKAAGPTTTPATEKLASPYRRSVPVTRAIFLPTERSFRPQSLEPGTLVAPPPAKLCGGGSRSLPLGGFLLRALSARKRVLEPLILHGWCALLLFAPLLDGRLLLGALGLGHHEHVE